MRNFVLEGWGAVKGSTWSDPDYPVIWTLEFHVRKRSRRHRPIDMVIHLPLKVRTELPDLFDALARDTVSSDPFSAEEREDCLFFGGAHEPIELPSLHLQVVPGEDRFEGRIGGLSELNDHLTGRVRFDFSGPVYLREIGVQHSEVPDLDQVIARLNAQHGEDAFVALHEAGGITLLHRTSIFPRQRIPNEGTPTPNRKLSPERQQEILDQIPLSPNDRARDL